MSCGHNRDFCSKWSNPVTRTPGVPSSNYWVSTIKKKQKQWNFELWIRNCKLMTTMQIWEKASHWPKTYFSLATQMHFLLISRKIWLKSCGKPCNFISFFIADSAGNSWCPWDIWSKERPLHLFTKYRVFFLTGPPLKMSLDWPPP